MDTSSIDDVIHSASDVAMSWYTLFHPDAAPVVVRNPPATVALTSQGFLVSSGTGSVAIWIGLGAVALAVVLLVRK